MISLDTHLTNLFQKFLRFGLVGTLGFITDAGILYLGIHLFGLGNLTARIPSFLIAVLVTWYFNRGFTFKASHQSFKESFPTYITANAIGLAINFGTYTFFVSTISFFSLYPILALAIGSILSMFFNFFAAHNIFKKSKD